MPVVAADHTVGVTSPIDAVTANEHVPALAKTSEAANVIMPYTVIVIS